MEKIFEQARLNVGELFRKEAIKITDTKIPKSRGVYLIRKDGIIVYDGESGDLQIRLKDHCSGEKENTTSGTFRNSVAVEKNIPFGRELQNYIRENYYFAWIEVEALSIVCARRENPLLLNK